MKLTSTDPIEAVKEALTEYIDGETMRLDANLKVSYWHTDNADWFAARPYAGSKPPIAASGAEHEIFTLSGGYLDPDNDYDDVYRKKEAYINEAIDDFQDLIMDDFQNLIMDEICDIYTEMAITRCKEAEDQPPEGHKVWYSLDESKFITAPYSDDYQPDDCIAMDSDSHSDEWTLAVAADIAFETDHKIAAEFINKRVENKKPKVKV